MKFSFSRLQNCQRAGYHLRIFQFDGTFGDKPSLDRSLFQNRSGNNHVVQNTCISPQPLKADEVIVIHSGCNLNFVLSESLLVMAIICFQWLQGWLRFYFLTCALCAQCAGFFSRFGI